MSETDKKIDAIVCNRVEGHPTPIEGSMKEHCSKCGFEVWITPKTVEVKIRAEAKIVCIPCILPELKKDPEFFITPSQVEEAADHIKKEIQKN
jgi:superfamily II helicase